MAALRSIKATSPARESLWYSTPLAMRTMSSKYFRRQTTAECDSVEHLNIPTCEALGYTILIASSKIWGLLPVIEIQRPEVEGAGFEHMPPGSAPACRFLGSAEGSSPAGTGTWSHNTASSHRLQLPPVTTRRRPRASEHRSHVWRVGREKVDVCCKYSAHARSSASAIAASYRRRRSARTEAHSIQRVNMWLYTCRESIAFTQDLAQAKASTLTFFAATRVARYHAYDANATISNASSEAATAAADESARNLASTIIPARMRRHYLP